jgi:hypothetical protein
VPCQTSQFCDLDLGISVLAISCSCDLVFLRSLLLDLCFWILDSGMIFDWGRPVTWNGTARSMLSPGSALCQ